jgi:hypothetical protein
MPGSEGGGWKRARKSNALTAYPTPERVCPKVRAKHRSEPPVLEPGEPSVAKVAMRSHLLLL